MAIRGRKPTPPGIKLVMGNPGRRPIPQGELDMREEPLEPHAELTEAQQRLWDRYINTAWWLTDHDAPKAHAWVCLQSEFDNAPHDMVAARIANLRALGSELGLDPAARTRLAGASRVPDTPAARFFND
jgi:phage terminase small subunit